MWFYKISLLCITAKLMPYLTQKYIVKFVIMHFIIPSKDLGLMRCWNKRFKFANAKHFS